MNATRDMMSVISFTMHSGSSGSSSPSALVLFIVAVVCWLGSYYGWFK